MDATALLKKVRKIEIKSKALSQQLFSGEYHSAFKGRGMSFSEVRAYQYGDDVRAIDWNVTARTGDPHVKVFEEERELTIMLLIDVSGSMYFGTRTQLKSELLTELSAVLAFSAIHHQDKVGVIFFADTVLEYIPPQKGRFHTLRIVRALLNQPMRSQRTNLTAALEHLQKVQKKRTTCFILSDFLETAYEKPLRQAAKRHDVIGIQLTDNGEAVLPKVGLLRVRDAETGAIQLIDTASAAVRMGYTQWHTQQMQATEQQFRKVGADFLRLQTGEKYIPLLMNFFQQRHG